MENVVNWVEKNPWLAGLIGLGGLLVLLWLLGFFSSSSSSSSSSNGLAAAYYNAEAAQTTAGTNLQMATEYYNAQTAQDAIQAQGAEAIATTQAGMYTTLGQQNASTTTALGYDQLLASNNSNDDALQATENTNSYNYQIAQAGYAAQNYATYANSVFPIVYAKSAGDAQVDVPGVGTLFTNVTGPVSPTQLEAIGYTQAGAAALTGQPIGNVT